jgi:hypothetical protein
LFIKLSKIWVLDPGSGIGKNLFRIPDPETRIPDPGLKGMGSRIRICNTAIYIILRPTKFFQTPGEASFSLERARVYVEPEMKFLDINLI